MQSVKVWGENFLIVNNAVSSQKISNSFSKNLLKKPKIFQLATLLKKIDSFTGAFRVLFLHFFFNWDSLHARLNSHYGAWSYKKRSTKKITGYRKSIQKEPTVRRCLLILDLKPPRSQVKGKHSAGGEFQSLAMRGRHILRNTFAK